MFRVLCAAMGFTLLVAACSSGVSEEDYQAALDAEASATARADELAAQLGIATSDLADAQAAAAYTEGERDAVTAARDSAERVVTDLRGELAAAAEELVGVEEQLAGVEEQLVAALVAAALAATDSLDYLSIRVG